METQEEYEGRRYDYYMAELMSEMEQEMWEEEFEAYADAVTWSE